MEIILTIEAKSKLNKEITNIEGFIKTLALEYPKYEFYPVGDIQMSISHEGKTFFVEGTEENKVAKINNITPLVVVKAGE